MGWLTLILKYLAIALQVIPIIQQAIPTAPGPAKNAVAVALINPAEADKPAVATLVTNLVTAMVAGGAWEKNKAPGASVVPPVAEIPTPGAV